jgi:hypothetical protein
MAQILPWVALVLSVLVLAYTATRGSGSGRAMLHPFAGVAGALVLLGVLSTLPEGGVWSHGQAIWPGMALGGLAVIAAAFLTARLTPDSRGFLGAAAHIAAPAAGVSLIVALYPSLRHGVIYTYGGFLMGALAAGMVLIAAALTASRDDETAADCAGAALPAVALAVTTLLATLHEPGPSGVREWMALPALLASTAAAAMTVRGALPGRSVPLSLAVVVIPVGIMAALIAFRMSGTPAFLKASLVGVGVFLLVAWLGQLDSADKPRFRADTGLLAALLVLGGAALAFRELHGYGLALAGLCGVFVAPVLGPDSRTTSGAFAQRGVVLMLLLAVYRIFTELNSYTSGFEPDLLYFYVALVAGALLPALLAGSAFRWTAGAADRTSVGGAVVRMALVGAGAVLAPLIIWVLVGERPQAALLVGLAVGAGFLLSRQVAGERSAAELSLAGMASLAIAWSAVQFTAKLKPLALASRVQRIELLAAIGVVALIIIGLTAALESRKPMPASSGAE